MADDSAAKDEYARMIELVKHYATIQFAELSVFIVIMSAAGVSLFSPNTPRGAARVVLMFGAALTALCLWVIHESNSYQMWLFLKRAAQLEEQLGYQGYSKLRIRAYWLGPGTLAFRSLYVLLILFWLAGGFGRLPEPGPWPDPRTSNQALQPTPSKGAGAAER